MNLRLNDYVERIRARCKSFEGRVAGAAQWAQDTLRSLENAATPSAYVMLSSETASEGLRMAQYHQDVEVAFSIMVIVGGKNRSDPRGQNFLLQIDAIREELFKAILFWTPDERKYWRTVFEGSEVVHLDTARMFYRFDFKTGYRLDHTDTFQDEELSKLPDLTDAMVEQQIEDLNVKSNFSFKE